MRLSGRVGLVAAVVLAASFGPSAAAQAPPPEHARADPEHLMVTGEQGVNLGVHPRLTAGSIVTVTVRGFRAFAPVEVRLVGTAALPSRPRADRDGVLRFLYRVPDDLAPGAHRLTFSGPGPDATPGPGASPAGVTIVVTVPNIAVVDLNIAP